MKILIIEDEHKIANAIKRGLEQTMFSVDSSYTGTEGYDLATEGNYDAIILDLMLPEMDGIQICKQLREKNNHTPILMLTAKSSLEDRIGGLNCGADDYLTKPFAFEELLARLQAILRRPKNIAGPSLSCGNLDLNPTSFKVTRGGKEIALSRKEFSLLEYMLRNKDKVLTKNQIISHVWDYDTDILPNTVEQFVGYLRGKIDKLFKNEKPLIQTVRGFGYKISDK